MGAFVPASETQWQSQWQELSDSLVHSELCCSVRAAVVASDQVLLRPQKACNVALVKSIGRELLVV